MGLFGFRLLWGASGKIMGVAVGMRNLDVSSQAVKSPPGLLTISSSEMCVYYGGFESTSVCGVGRG